MQSSRNRGITVVEILVAILLVTMVLFISYQVFHLLIGGQSRSTLTNLARRSFIQKDARSGVRRLAYRLREGIEILTPLPGLMSDELVFRDGTNSEVRLRHLRDRMLVISEKMHEGSWIREKEPMTVPTSSGDFPVNWPVTIENCMAIHFTVLSPDAVTIQASLTHEGQVGPLLTVVKLRNSRIAY